MVFLKSINFFGFSWLIENKSVRSFSYHFICVKSNDLKTTDSTFLASSQLTMTIHWTCYCTVHLYVAIHFCGSVWCFGVETNLCRFLWFVYICDRLQTQIGIHWRHHLKSGTVLRVFSNGRPFQILRSVADLFVRATVRACISDVIGRQFEKVRNGHKFENWMPI